VPSNAIRTATVAMSTGNQAPRSSMQAADGRACFSQQVSTDIRPLVSKPVGRYPGVLVWGASVWRGNVISLDVVPGVCVGRTQPTQTTLVLFIGRNFVTYSN